MQINLEEQQILELQATYSAEQVYGLALSKRVEAFGQVARLLQRPKPDDIEITTNQKRYEPFWFAAGDARYSYDRRHVYRVDVGREVRSVTLLGKDVEATDEQQARCFEARDRPLLGGGAEGAAGRRPAGPRGTRAPQIPPAPSSRVENLSACNKLIRSSSRPLFWDRSSFDS